MFSETRGEKKAELEEVSEEEGMKERKITGKSFFMLKCNTCGCFIDYHENHGHFHCGREVYEGFKRAFNSKKEARRFLEGHENLDGFVVKLNSDIIIEERESIFTGLLVKIKSEMIGVK